jgi:YD repeat-containing protein
MHAATRLMLVAMPLALAAPAAAQEFRPPSGGGVPSSAGGLNVDLYGFSVRGGVDLTRGVRWVLGTTLDVAELWSPRVRFRPSVEIASDTGSTVTFHWAGEITYRFQPDNAPAIPYVGLGIGHRSSCRSCTTVWPTVVLGFELQLRPGFNWLLEYHALDRLGRHRFLLGLATRTAGGF